MTENERAWRQFIVGWLMEFGAGRVSRTTWMNNKWWQNYWKTHESPGNGLGDVYFDRARGDSQITQAALDLIARED